MEPLAVDLLLLRSLLTPGLRISPGRALMARVVRADGSGRGALSIAGEVVEAELPKQIRAGQDVRLVVRQVTADRVVLSLSDQAAIPVAPASVPLPGGGTVRVSEREEPAPGSPASDTQIVTLRYDAPTLGAVDLRFELDPASLRVAVTLAAGEPVRHARAESDALRQALQDNVERAVSVKVSARHEPLDLYA